jgi:hypothetical protein
MKLIALEIDTPSQEMPTADGCNVSKTRVKTFFTQYLSPNHQRKRLQPPPPPSLLKRPGSNGFNPRLPELLRMTSWRNTINQRDPGLQSTGKVGHKSVPLLMGFSLINLVYDATEFLKDHPGGGDAITLVAGTDATEDLYVFRCGR